MRRGIWIFTPIVCILVAHSQILIHTSQHKPDLPSSGPTTVQAATVTEFIGSIGVACHLNYAQTPYNRFTEVENLLLASGIRNIRDGGSDPLAVARLRALSKAGFKITWVLDAADGVVPTSQYWSNPPHYALQYFLNDVVGADVIRNIEIGNEIDIFHSNKKWHPQDHTPLSESASSPEFWGTYILNFTRDTSVAVRSDSSLSSIRLLGTSFGKNSAGVPNGAFAPLVDLGTFHPYMYRGNSAVRDKIPYDGVGKYFVQSTQPTVQIDEYPTEFNNFSGPYLDGISSKPMVATETGYYTGSAQYSISELAQAKYIPRIFAEFFRHSIPNTFAYEFVDEGSDSAMENSFGLVRSDLKPKPAYTALQSLIHLLEDGGKLVIKPDKLTYEFSPSPNGVFVRTQYAHDLLLEKSNSEFYLLFWHEISDSNRANTSGLPVLGTNVDVEPLSLPVIITLPDNAVSVKLYSYDPQWKLQSSDLLVRSHKITVNATDTISVLRFQSQPNGDLSNKHVRVSQLNP